MGTTDTDQNEIHFTTFSEDPTSNLTQTQNMIRWWKNVQINMEWFRLVWIHMGKVKTILGSFKTA